MNKPSRKNAGIRLLLKQHRELFQIPENLNHYTESDYRIAERKFLKSALRGMKGRGERVF
jgi:hypothetical protein